jgi:hypothetical protein
MCRIKWSAIGSVHDMPLCCYFSMVCACALPYLSVASVVFVLCVLYICILILFVHSNQYLNNF